jgi:hypothetical protein
LFVLVVKDVKVETVDGDVSRPLAAANTALWSSTGSSSDEESVELVLRFDMVCRRRRRGLLGSLSLEEPLARFTLVFLVFVFAECLLLPDVDLCTLFDLSFSFPVFVFVGGIIEL